MRIGINKGLLGNLRIFIPSAFHSKEEKPCKCFYGCLRLLQFHSPSASPGGQKREGLSSSPLPVLFSLVLKGKPARVFFQGVCAVQTAKLESSQDLETSISWCTCIMLNTSKVLHKPFVE